MEANLIKVRKELLDNFLSKKHLNETDWEELEGSVNLLHNNFACKLCRNFSMLSKDDVHIILLMRIGMKNVKIARLLHILPKSFGMRRYRLKMKMGVECKSLPKFIRGLFESEK
ncbi:hypothetical protein [Bacteroides sp. UBA939]|uniref:hypothetical protein n=1 Tax=Bacteroides sp. UBA939 TaxID=1946092 RepID=UPI0025BA2AEF|nr:hypothetical protein [Bacteroides sp. UBA939]